jgi:MFS family permease
MRAETAALERATAVREAARRWRAAGVIDGRTEEAIGSEYPDPRVRPSPVWRVLTFLFVTVIVLGVFFALSLSGVPGLTGLAFYCLLAGSALVVATERQEQAPPLARRGGAGATALWAGVFLTAAAGLFSGEVLLFRGERGFEITLAVSVLVWGAASWRWGSAVFALISSLSLFFLLGRQPYGRLFWVLVGVILAILSWRHLDDRSWPPPHRESAAALLVVALAAVYAATNYWSVETWWIERFRRDFSWTDPPRAGLVAAMAATALMPAALLAWGIRTRRTLLIDTGAVFLILSAITLRHYVRIAPLWAVLAGAGAILLGLALVVERWLSRGAGKERGGFTAEPLFSDETKARLLQTIPVAATLQPEAPPPPERGFTPGGGSFGGGGARERF